MKTRNLSRMLLAAVGTGGLALAHPARGADAWWQELDAAPLAELDCSRAEDLVSQLPAPWKVRQGSFRKHQTAGSAGSAPQMDMGMDDLLGDGGLAPLGAGTPGEKGKTTLEALDTLEIYAPGAEWRHLAVAAEVKMIAGAEIALVAGTEQPVAGDGGYGLVVRPGRGKTVVAVRGGVWRAGAPVARGTLDAGWRDFHLRPDLKRLAATPGPIYSMHGVPPEEQQAKLAEYTRTEAFPDQDWDNHWLHLRIDLTPWQVRLWINGNLVGSLDFPEATSGGVALKLNRRDHVRALRVEAVPEATAGFLPLDLTGKFNNDGFEGGDLGDGSTLEADGLPPAGRPLLVQGAPFLWTAAKGRPNNIDLAQATVRGGGRFFSFNPMEGDRRRVMFRVPRRAYNEMRLLVAADSRAAATNAVTVRMVKAVRCHYVDATGQVPGWNTAAAWEGCIEVARLPVQAARGRSGGTRPLWLLRVPLDPGAFQDFLGDPRERYLDLDLMTGTGHKGLHVFAATLVESPVELKVVSDEIGHIFTEPQVPRFRCILRNTTATPRTGPLVVQATDYYGATQLVEQVYQVPPMGVATQTVELPAAVRGIHYFEARLGDAAGQPLMRRQTTYAVLAPDTREADRDSPFGMWSFGSGHYGGGEAPSIDLMRKIGVRWSHHGDPAQRVYRGYHNIVRGFGPDDPVESWLASMQDKTDYGHWSVFAEVAISGRHYNYFPTELLESGNPMALTPDEETTFRRLWQSAVRASETARKYHPDKPLVFGNGYPQFIWTFLSRGYPRHYFDGLALDFIGDRMSMFFYLREVAKHYGYGEVPMYITEGFYLGSERGYYPSRASEDRQAMGYLRGYLAGFANGMKAFIGACEVWDVGGGYYYTGYGPLGVCRRAPEMNPKPAYCMYGTMSLLLDRAAFHSLVPTGSMCVYMTRFDGPRGPVYAVWTADGSTRAIRFAAEPGRTPRRTDHQGNSFPLTAGGDGFALEAGPVPMWIEDAGVIASAASGPADYDGAPAAGARVLFSAAADLSAWSIDAAAYPFAEEVEANRPVRATAFRPRQAAGRTPSQPALALSPEATPGVSPYRLRYAVLRPAAPPLVPAGTTHLGAWVHGNGAAILDFELTDANGQVWTTLRGPSAYSFGMSLHEDAHQFEGWRYIEVALTPSRRSRWRTAPGGKTLALPAKLTGLVLGQYGQVVYLNALRDPIEPEWRLGEVMISGAAAAGDDEADEAADDDPPAPGPQVEI